MKLGENMKSNIHLDKDQIVSIYSSDYNKGVLFCFIECNVSIYLYLFVFTLVV